MKMDEFVNKLNDWVSYYGQSKESLNDFANFNATSCEEYNAIWEIIDEIFKGNNLCPCCEFNFSEV